MLVKNISHRLFIDDSKNIADLLMDNFSNEMLDKLYFIPKKIDKSLINEKIKDSTYINKVLRTINYYKDKDIEQLIYKKFLLFADYFKIKPEAKLFIIIGLDTTTIYSTNLDGEDVTVLLLEATNGTPDLLDILLAHEFTHFIRKQLLNKNIFEDSLGERLVTEGIASNYSEEVVPNMLEEDFCIVNSDTIKWVKDNINIIERDIKGKINTNELISNYFYMYANLKNSNMPVRTGYVYGYLKVKEYLEKNNLKIKDIIGIDWGKIID